MIRQLWQNLSININNKKHERQVKRLLSNNKKIRNITSDGDNVYYQQLTWVQE